MAVAAPDRVAAPGGVELEGDEDLAAPALDPAGTDRRLLAQAQFAAMLARRQLRTIARIRRSDSNSSAKRTATRAATSPARWLAVVTCRAS